MERVLCFLAINPEYTEFAIPQLKSLLAGLQIPLEELLADELKGRKVQQSYQINYQMFQRFPFVVLTVPDFQKHRYYFEQLSKSAVMIYRTILLISQGRNYQELISQANQQLLQSLCKNNEDTVVCDFNSRNRVIGRQEQVQKIHGVLRDLDVKGHVTFKSPSIRYQLVEYHEWFQKHHLKSTAETLKHVYFGIELSCNHKATAKFNQPFQLKKRIYLGPTSTDNDLAFLMCNQGLITAGSMVLDPFVGTAGLLIPPASKGALVFGSDLDIRVLNGYSVGRINRNSPFYKEEAKYQLFTPKINLNFEQYGLAIPNIFRIDSTKSDFRATQLFDAIITDPPYGIRAMSRSITKKSDISKQTEHQVQEKQQQEESQKKQPSHKQQTQGEQGIQRGQYKVEESRKGDNWKTERRRALRENKKKKKELLSQEQKQFKMEFLNRMNKQRVQQWEKFDKTKVETTQRQQIFQGMLTIGSKYLKKGGRLVFLYPIYEDEEYQQIQSLPKHEGFAVIDLSQNKMSKGNSRVLVTLQKL